MIQNLVGKFYLQTNSTDDDNRKKIKIIRIIIEHQKCGKLRFKQILSWLVKEVRAVKT